MERLIAIGDIHGCFHTLKNLLAKVNYASATDILVFVGDYIDRGPFSCEVVEFIKHLQHQVGKDKCVCLRGNHEQMAIDAGGTEDPLWMQNGGYATIYSYEKAGIDIANSISWFKTLPLVYDTPEIIFCHAGLAKPQLKDNTEFDILWSREWLKDTEPREKQVVFGHTPNRKGLAYAVPTGDICIDSACYYGGSLCALVINEDGTSESVYAPKAEEDKED